MMMMAVFNDEEDQIQINDYVVLLHSHILHLNLIFMVLLTNGAGDHDHWSWQS